MIDYSKLSQQEINELHEVNRYSQLLDEIIDQLMLLEWSSPNSNEVYKEIENRAEEMREALSKYQDHILQEARKTLYNR